MDHTQAIELKAIERYLLQDLSVRDREAFEEHAFVCPACASELKLGYYFRENGRVVAAEVRTAHATPVRKLTQSTAGDSWKARFRPWFQLPSLAPTLCAMALLTVAVGQYAELRRPAVYAEQAVTLRGAIREGDVPIKVLAGSASRMSGDYVLGSEYTWQLKDSSGSVLAESKNAATATDGKFHLIASPLKAGSYTLVLTNPAGGKSAHYRFEAVKQ